MSVLSRFQTWSKDLSAFFIYLLFISTLGPFLFGFHLAELNAPSDVITCAKRGITVTSFLNLPQCIRMTAGELGMVSSLFTVGGFFGALSAGPTTARYGRLTPMRYITFFFALGPIAEALAPSIAVLAAGRFISGLGAGAATVIVPLYISEIAPPKDRGLFGAFTQITTNCGIFVAQLLGYFLSHDQMWRVILGFAGTVGLVQLIGLLLAVDSPKWQADHDRTREAKINLQRIRGQNANISEEIQGWKADTEGDADGEAQRLLASEAAAGDGPSSSKVAKKESLGILEVAMHPDYSPAIIAVVAVMAAQQLTGINSIIMYGVSLLADLLASNSALLNIFVSIINIVVTTSCAPLSDILGRKTCILTSIAGMGVSSVLLGIGIRSAIPVLSALSVLLFVASFGFGLGPVPFILASELVGPEAVGATQSWALGSNWIATFIVAQFFPMVNERLGKGIVYFIFGGAAVLFFAFISWWVPETKGKKTMEEVWGKPPRRED